MEKSIVFFNLASLQVQIVGQYLHGQCGVAEMAVAFDTDEAKMEKVLNTYGLLTRLRDNRTDLFTVLSSFVYYLNMTK